MTIIRDTREQCGYTFERFGVQVIEAGLPTGDYSIPGFEDMAAIERKGLDDLIGCLTQGRTRFERELARARHYELFAVVVESNLADVIEGRYKSRMNPGAAVQSVAAFQIRYLIPFMFCGDRTGAEYMAFSLLAKFLYEIEARYKAAVKFQGGDYHGK